MIPGSVDMNKNTHIHSRVMMPQLYPQGLHYVTSLASASRLFLALLFLRWLSPELLPPSPKVECSGNAAV